MASLLEAIVSLTIAAALLASTLMAMQQAVRIGGRIDEEAQALLARRQFEALVDRAAQSAGAGPSRPAPLGEVSADKAVFRADLDGDGKVSDSGSETIAVEVRSEASATHLRHRLGKQTMTVLDFDRAAASIVAYDRAGRSTTAAASASLVEVTVQRRDSTLADAATDTATLQLLFAVPEATAR